MQTINITQARKQLYKLVDQTATEHKPIHIIGKRHNAVLISQEDWAVVQETLYLSSIPGLVDSIKEGMKEPLSECSKEPKW